VAFVEVTVGDDDVGRLQRGEGDHPGPAELLRPAAPEGEHPPASRTPRRTWRFFSHDGLTDLSAT
jgi:hypothetical protein